MSEIIIFDFDGTIADSSTLIRSIYNDMAALHGWPALGEADYQRLRGAGFAEAQRWTGIKSWQIPGLMREGLKTFRSHSSEVTLFAGIPELIKQLAKADKTIYVLSTNTPETIQEVLARYELKGLVTVLKRSALFGKHHAIKHLLAKNKYAAANVWMVGDEVRDIEAAKRAGVKSAAVTWGLQNIDVLKTANPNLITNTPGDLLKIISS